MAKILIIEDDPYVQRMYKRLFSHNKYELITAAKGEEGLLLANDIAPDIILLDIMLPEMNGIEVLTNLKNNPKTQNIPVIMLTNLADTATMDTAHSLGADSYMVKADFSPQQLLNEIDKRLDS